PRPLRLGADGDAGRQGDRPPRPRAAGRAAGRGPAMTARIYIPRDAGAIAVGADDVASALVAAARRRNLAIEVVRTGSRGLYWLEPMIEVATPAGRIAYGPVRAGDVESLLEAGLLEGGGHSLRIGLPEDVPFLKRQTRLTFARCGITDPLSIEDYRAHG